MACAVAAAAPFSAGALAWRRWRWPRRSDFYIPAPVRNAWQALPPAPRPLRAFGTWFANTHTRNMQLIGGWLADVLPKGLYARALIIIIAPIVVLEGVVAFVFMERHWQAVTRRLSEATARDIAAVIDIYEEYPQQGRVHAADRDGARPAQPVDAGAAAGRSAGAASQAVLRAARPRAVGRDPPAGAAAVLDRHRRPVAARGNPRQAENAILRFVATRSQTYASNSHIFLLWMIGSSVILLTVAILFLRNQIRPILRLAEAADAFGKGRRVPDDFRPRGAREVRQAATAFLEMRDRITTHVEQRTTMLAGVSHDLRTILTRFKLELALLGDTPEALSLQSDVREMQDMLEDYLAFAKGDGGEESAPTNLRELLEEVHDEAQYFGTPIELKLRKRREELVLPLKRQAFKRAITNLVSNAARFGDQIIIRGAVEGQWVRIEVDDNGPGIPAAERANVFKPFYRLDHARNQDEGNTGLGLAIARDIAKSHGGDITLGESSMGGLRAIISVPL